MVKYRKQADTFAALADDTRVAIVDRLADGERSLGDLAERFPMSLPAVAKHVGVLERAGLVRTRKVGRVRLCRLEPARLREASAWLEAARAKWEMRLDRLERHLEGR